MSTTHGSLCTGYGGLDMAAQAVFGGELAWWSDIEPGPIAVMGKHHPVPNIGDVKTVPWSAVPRVDILTAGYPCQPFSNAGLRLGTEDPRHLWPWIARGIGVLRPRIVILENVAGHLRRGFDVVSADLATLGYDTAWTVVRASDVGAPHQRARLFVVASDTRREPVREQSGGVGRSRRAGSSVARLAGEAATDTSSARLQVGAVEHHGPQRATAERSGGQLATDAEGQRRHERRSEHAGLEGSADAAGDRCGRVERWGSYAAAVVRWERITGRVAPEPTVTGARGAKVLSPYLVEWMMGLDEGHVTGVEGLSRNQMLKLLGNGVVPQQAEFAIRGLWDRLECAA